MPVSEPMAFVIAFLLTKSEAARLGEERKAVRAALG